MLVEWIPQNRHHSYASSSELINQSPFIQEQGMINAKQRNWLAATVHCTIFCYLVMEMALVFEMA
jgi:hypothetical protein